MSSRFLEDVNFLEGIDYSQLRFGRFSTATVVTGEVSASGSEEFSASGDEGFVQELTTVPEDADLPDIARFVAIKVNVRGSSTNSEIKVFQSEERNEIDQVIAIEEISVNSTPETYVLGAGMGIPFANKERDNDVYFEVNEKSDNPAEYDIEINWLNIPG